MLTEGMYIADRYEILGKVGAGGMSDVYKAKDLTLGRFVAIKVLKAEFSEDINFVTKFRSEAQAVAETTGLYGLLIAMLLLFVQPLG